MRTFLWFRLMFSPRSSGFVQALLFPAAPIAPRRLRLLSRGDLSPAGPGGLVPQSAAGFIRGKSPPLSTAQFLHLCDGDSDHSLRGGRDAEPIRALGGPTHGGWVPTLCWDSAMY